MRELEALLNKRCILKAEDKELRCAISLERSENLHLIS